MSTTNSKAALCSCPWEATVHRCPRVELLPLGTGLKSGYRQRQQVCRAPMTVFKAPNIPSLGPCPPPWSLKSWKARFKGKNKTVLLESSGQRWRGPYGHSRLPEVGPTATFPSPRKIPPIPEQHQLCRYTSTFPQLSLSVHPSFQGPDLEPHHFLRLSPVWSL